MSSPLQDPPSNAEQQILFIQALNFYSLSSERLHALAAQVEEVSIPPGVEIIQQGTEWDCSYFIQSGQVELLVRDYAGVENRLCTLTSAALLGEATIVSPTVSQATVRTLDQCVMLKLKHEHLTELSENKKNIAHTFMSLMIDKIKPVQESKVSSHVMTSVDGQDIVMLKNPKNGSYFKVSQQAFFIWKQLTGKYTLREITLFLADTFNVFAPDRVAALISKLATAGMIENIIVDTVPQPTSLWSRIKARVRSLLHVNIVMHKTDQWMTSSYHRAIYLLFTRPAQIIFSLLALVGACLFVMNTHQMLFLFKTLPTTGLLVGLLVPCCYLAKIAHEFSYAYATKAYGYHIHYIEMGWRWFKPVVFIDTSDMWLSTRRSRILFSLVGILFDLSLGGIAALGASVLSNENIQAFLWLFALYNYFHALKTLNPLQERGGYSALTDLLDCSYLRQSAITWLREDFSKAIRHPRLFLKNRSEVFYWLAGVAFLFLTSVFILLGEICIFNVLGIHLTNVFVVCALPFFVVLVLSLSMITDLRNHAVMKKI